MEPATDNSSGDKSKSDSTLDSALAKVPTPESSNSKEFPSTIPGNIKAKPRKHGIKRLAIVILAVLLLVGLGGGIYWFFPGDYKTRVCKGDLLTSARKAFDDKDFTAALKVVSEITQEIDYVQDPNCLYVTLNYSLMFNMTPSSTELTSFNRLYNPWKGLDRLLGVSRFQIGTFRTKVQHVIDSAPKADPTESVDTNGIRQPDLNDIDSQASGNQGEQQ